MDLFLSLLVVVLMIGGFLTAIVGLFATLFVKKWRGNGALACIIGIIAFVAGSILGQFTL